MTRERTVDVAIHRVSGDEVRPIGDTLAVEAPLELRVATPDRSEPRAVSLTMRTPGDDAALAVGYLVAEGIVYHRAQIVGVRSDGADAIVVALAESADLAPLSRTGVMSSACGVCGRTSVESLRVVPRWPLDVPCLTIAPSTIHALPARLREAQRLFDSTGGLHAAALFDASGELHTLAEDVGRHNAVDKVVGAQLLAGTLPAHDRILLVSGRASYELVAKAIMAGIPLLAAVGAPSSLAVSLAASYGLTLLGFVRDDRFNVYAGGARVTSSAFARSAPPLSNGTCPAPPAPSLRSKISTRSA